MFEEMIAEISQDGYNVARIVMELKDGNALIIRQDTQRAGQTIMEHVDETGEIIQAFRGFS